MENDKCRTKPRAKTKRDHVEDQSTGAAGRHDIDRLHAGVLDTVTVAEAEGAGCRGHRSELSISHAGQIDVEDIAGQSGEARPVAVIFGK